MGEMGNFVKGNFSQRHEGTKEKKREERKKRRGRASHKGTKAQRGRKEF